MTTADKDKMYVRLSTFTWAVGLLAGMIVACVGWSLAAYSAASEAEKKVLELEIRLNRVDGDLDKRLSLIEQNTRAIAESLKRHEEDTRGFTKAGTAGLGQNQRDLGKVPQGQLRSPEP